MQVKKLLTDARRLHAAPAETDPGSIELILLHTAGHLPAVRLLALPRAPGFAPHAPAWRRRCAVLKKSIVLPA